MASRKLTPWHAVLGHAALVLLSAVFVLPFLWLVSTSLKPDEDLMEVPTHPRVLLPKGYFAEVDGRVRRVLPGKKLVSPHVIVKRHDTGERALVPEEDWRGDALREWVVRQGKPEERWVPATLEKTLPADPQSRWWYVTAVEDGEPVEGQWDCVPAEAISRGLAPQFSNYSDGLRKQNFARYYLNSVLVSVSVVFLTVLMSSYVAYGFGVLQWRGRDTVFFVLLATMMLPHQVTMIPLFLLFRNLGWINTYRPLIVPAMFGNTFFIFLLRQFYRGLPRDLFDAARIDGCSEWRIWWTIVLPLSRPALMTVGLFSFLHVWNDFLGPLIYLTSQKRYTISVALALFRGEYGSNYGMLMAMAVLTLLPVVILFFLAQKTFIQGIKFTGQKG